MTGQLLTGGSDVGTGMNYHCPLSGARRVIRICENKGRNKLRYNFRVKLR